MMDRGMEKLNKAEPVLCALSFFFFSLQKSYTESSQFICGLFRSDKSETQEKIMQMMDFSVTLFWMESWDQLDTITVNSYVL